VVFVLKGTLFKDNHYLLLSNICWRQALACLPIWAASSCSPD